jgi:hypothetical protein
MLEWVADILTVIGLLAALALIVLIVRALLKKVLKPRKEDVLAASSVSADSVSDEGREDLDEAPEAPARQESEPQRLARMEKELAERDAKAKAEKIRELQERERIIKRRQQEDILVAASAEPEEPKDEILKERQKILDLIKKTEERYAGGDMEEKSFKRILSDYQQQIIDIDIQLRKRKGK